MAENDPTKNFTINVRNVPNAKILIERKERSFIEVEKGTVCHWKVTAPGYRDQIGEVKVVSDINLTLTLQKVPPKPTPNNAYMKVRPKKGSYVVDYKELFKDIIPPTEDHDDEYLWCSHGYLWWKKLEIPTPEDLIVQDLGDSVTKAISQNAMTQFLSEKANASDVYDKAFIETALSKKLDIKDALNGASLERTVCVLKGLDEFEPGSKIIFDGYAFEYGLTAFSTISEALDCDNVETILLGTGTFEEDLIVNKNAVKLLGYGDAVINGRIEINSNKTFSMKNLSLLYTPEESEEVTSAITINNPFVGLDLNDVNIVVKGNAHILDSKRRITDSRIIDCHFITGVDQNNEMVDGFVMQNVNNLHFSRNSMFGNLDLSGAIKDIEVSTNNFTASNGTLIKLHDGRISDKINIFGNLAFGADIENIVSTENLDYSTLENFNLIGNHVCYTHAFLWIKQGCFGIDNNKASLSFNTANNAPGSRFVFDDEQPLGGDPRIVAGAGNIITDDQAVTIEQVNSIVTIERERAMAAEDRINDILAEHLANYNNPHRVTKEQVGLGNVDNTSDLDKPISTATQAALDEKLDTADLPTRLPNPTRLEMVCNGKFVGEYYGGEPNEEVVWDLHFDRNTSAQLAWLDVKGVHSDEEMVNITSDEDFEKGQVLYNHPISWDPIDVPCMDIKCQWIDDLKISDTDRFYLIPELSSDYHPVVKLLYANEEGSMEEYQESVQAVAHFRFLNRIYWGGSESDTISDAEILQLNNKLAADLIHTLEFDCTGGKYMYMAIPKDLIDDEIIIMCGGIRFSDWESNEIQFTNKHGYTTDYVVFRSNNKQTAKHIEVTVK